MKILTNYDFNGNEIQNIKIQNLATAPATPTKGQIYFNTSSNRLFTWDGSEWIGADAIGATMTGSDIVTAINGSASIIDDDNLSSDVNDAITDSHTHSNTLVLDNTTASYTTEEETKLAGIDEGANNYSLPVATDVLLGGVLSGTDITIDASGNVTVNDDSHNHIIDNVDGLQSALDGITIDALSDITDVTITTVADGEVLRWVTDHWENSTLEEASIQTTTEKGVANGYASLDGNAKVPTDQLPDTVLGQLTYKGVLDASTASYPESPFTGDYWVVSVAGVISTVDYEIGDWAVYNGSTWDKIDNSDKVSSVAGKTGAVTLEASDITDFDTEVGNNTTVVAKTDKHSEAIGDGTSTSIVVTHDLNSRDVVVSLRETASPYAQVVADVEMTTVNTITVKFAVEPTTDEYTVTVIG